MCFNRFHRHDLALIGVNILQYIKVNNIYALLTPCTLHPPTRPLDMIGT